MLRIIRFRDVGTKFHFSRLLTQKVSVGEIGADLQKEIDNMPRIRPSGQPPKVWQLIKKTDKNGKLMKFTVQEIPEDRYEDAVQHMCTYFLADEPTCNCLNSINDPLFVQDISTIWRLLFAEGISIAAFTDNPNGGKPIIAGMNALGIDTKDQKDSISGYQFKSENCKNTFNIISNATKIIYERYGVDKYLYAIGLSVHPDYRGYGLGKDLLKIRNLLGPMYGVSATATAFTSIISQKSAAGAGFEEFLTQNFADLVKEDGTEYYPGIKSKAFKIMGKKLP
jgi:ribosomal protein S18 acetylase RimI-like enzyme